MEKDYLVNTNIFIDLMAGRFSETVRQKLNAILSSVFFISVINKIEMLGFQHLVPADAAKFDLILKVQKLFICMMGSSKKQSTFEKCLISNYLMQLSQLLAFVPTQFY